MCVNHLHSALIEFTAAYITSVKSALCPSTASELSALSSETNAQEITLTPAEQRDKMDPSFILYTQAAATVTFLCINKPIGLFKQSSNHVILWTNFLPDLTIPHFSLMSADSC